MAATILTAHAPAVRFEREGSADYGVYDGSGRKVGHVNVIRGFGHYTGSMGSAHYGVYAVVALSGASTMDRIEEALRVGLRNGRRDDLAND